MSTTSKRLLKDLNTTYFKLHKKYEDLYWVSYMGDHSVDERLNKAKNALEKFRTNKELSAQVASEMKRTKGKEKERLNHWRVFFEKHQTPDEVIALRQKIADLETLINKKQSSLKEGYIDPKTKKFIKTSRNQMYDIMGTHDDEKVRKACFESLEKLAQSFVSEYMKLVSLRNEYARALGFEDFYAYKVYTEEGMTKKELFKIFDAIYNKTKYAFKAIRRKEKKMKGLRKPWNKGYMLSGDFTKEEEPYYPFEESLTRWGTSFAALGIDFTGGTLQLDLLDRKGKYNNGFCHWPELVQYKGKKRIPGKSNFTCNVVYGQLGSSEDGYRTLFHEGGHAAHLLNSTQREVCMSNEYPPASTAWDETQSIFLDSMYGSIEWSMRYAKDTEGNTYPFSLFERELKELHFLRPLGMMGITMVMDFERQIYETQNLTKTKLLKIARDTHLKYTDSAVSSLRLLDVPHIYSWESACSYHGYGLAILAVSQWREYFYKKYDYIVDNPRVGRELRKMWQLGSSKTFKECVILATGKRLTPQAYLKGATASLDAVLKVSKKRIARLERVKKHTKNIDLKAKIRMVHGKKVICDNKKSFEDMASKYGVWLKTQRVAKPKK